MSTPRKTDGTKVDPAPAAVPHPAAPDPATASEKVPEAGGRGGLDPTRYGDWEKNGRCVDF